MVGGWMNPLQPLPQGLVLMFEIDIDPDSDPELNNFQSEICSILAQKILCHSTLSLQIILIFQCLLFVSFVLLDVSKGDKVPVLNFPQIYSFAPSKTTGK